MPAIRGVMLDVDGTLVDSNDAHAHAWVAALAEHGHEVEFERLRRLIGMGGEYIIAELTGLEHDSSQSKAISASWRTQFEQNYLPHLRGFPEVRPLLERMHADGLRLVVASTSEGEVLQKLLDIAHVRDLIEEPTSQKPKRPKPAPDIVLAALEQLGLPAEETVMIGDTPFDLEAADKAGVAVIGVRCGGWSNDDLKGALAVYADPADLLAHYDESPLARDRA